jgi:hypothetical protein
MEVQPPGQPTEVVWKGFSLSERKGSSMSELSRSSLLSFPLVLKDGTYLETAGDAVDYFFGLTPGSATRAIGS